MSSIMAMPKIGVNMTEATIAKWLVSEGDHVVEGQPVLEAETDKLTQEIPSTVSGKIVKFLAFEGDTVEILQPVAVVEGEGAQDQKPPAAPAAPPVPKEELAPAKAARIKISPLAKKTAKSLGIDYALVKPGRSGARICKEDILKFAGQNKAGESIPPPAIEPTKKTAHAPAENAAAAQVTLALRADMTQFLDLLSKIEANGGKAGLEAMLAFCVSRALREFPELANPVNIGVAADAKNGQMTVICGCDKKSLTQIGAELEQKQITVESSTFAIVNLGMFEIEYFAPAPPAAGCMLGTGTVAKTPVAVTKNGADAIEIRPMMSLALCFGPGNADEATAARFLQRVKHALENPALLLCM